MDLLSDKLGNGQIIDDLDATKTGRDSLGNKRLGAGTMAMKRYKEPLKSIMLPFPYFHHGGEAPPAATFILDSHDVKKCKSTAKEMSNKLTELLVRVQYKTTMVFPSLPSSIARRRT